MTFMAGVKSKQNVTVEFGGTSRTTTFARFCLRTLPRGGATRYAGDHGAAWRIRGVLVADPPVIYERCQISCPDNATCLIAASNY